MLRARVHVEHVEQAAPVRRLAPSKTASLAASQRTSVPVARERAGGGAREARPRPRGELRGEGLAVAQQPVLQRV